MLSKLILPTVFFYSTATMKLSNINVLVAALGLLSRFMMMLIYYVPIHLLYGDRSVRRRLEYWAISTLFITMSYDIPIGFPIASSIWTQHDDAQYILTWAALSKIFIMSLCIAMLNYCSSRQKHAGDTMTNMVARHFVSNPIVIGILLGLSLNVICCVVLQMDSIPVFIGELCVMIKQSYPFTALWIIGYGICESKCSLSSIPDKHIIALLVLHKLLVSPLVFYCCFTFIVEEESVQRMVAMACFYGMLPVSASPTVLSIQYNIYSDIMETATIICLVLSMPILIVFLFYINDDETAFASNPQYQHYFVNIAWLFLIL